MTITRATAQPVTLEQTAAGELDARLIGWDTPAEVSDDGGRTTYTEQWEPGSLLPGDRPAAVYGSHRSTADGRIERGPLIGVARDVEVRADGLYATLALAGTPAAAEIRELARLVGAYVSIEADTGTTAENGATIIRTAANPIALTGVAVILPPARPAFDAAEVLAVRAASPVDPDPDPDDPDPADPEHRIGRADVAEMVRGEVARMSHGTARASSAHPASQWRSLGGWAEAAWSARSAREDPASIARALANQITTDNPGVVPPGWVSNVYGIIARPQRTITAFGSFPDPGYGMTIDYPLFAGDLSTYTGVQTAEKTGIVSVKVSIGKGSVPLSSIGGGSDLSYQLIRRSSPSYKEAYLRIMAASYALTAENIAADAAATAAVASAATWTPATGTAAQLSQALFTASLEVENATGSPAGFALAASDVFAAIGGLQDLPPAIYGTANVAGTSQASTLRINVSGLEVFHVPQLAAGTLLVSNAEAAGWVSEGPYVVTAEDVELLGQNVAIWGMGAFVAAIPTGIRKIAAGAARSWSRPDVDHLIHRANKPGEGTGPAPVGVPVPDLPAHLYVTAAELAAELGGDEMAPWIAESCVTATAAVDQLIGPAGVERWLIAEPWPAPIRLAALTVAVDVYRRRTAPSGYFQTDDYLARLALDPTGAVAAHLAPYMLDLGVG